MYGEINQPKHHVSAHSTFRLPLSIISHTNATSARLRREALPALLLLSHWCQLTEVTVRTVQREPIDFWPTRVTKQCLPVFLNQYGRSASQQRRSDWLPLRWPSREPERTSTGRGGGNGQVPASSCSYCSKRPNTYGVKGSWETSHGLVIVFIDTTWTPSDLLNLEYIHIHFLLASWATCHIL